MPFSPFLSADYPTPPFKYRAYAKVTFPSGTVMKRRIVVFDACNHPVAHFPLTEELAFTEWYNTTFTMPSTISE